MGSRRGNTQGGDGLEGLTMIDVRGNHLSSWILRHTAMLPAEEFAGNLGICHVNPHFPSYVTLN